MSQETSRCDVRGHDHNLIIVKEWPGRGYLLECPSGMYRWLHARPLSEPVGKLVRMHKPRWGWSKRW